MFLLLFLGLGPLIDCYLLGTFEGRGDGRIVRAVMAQFNDWWFGGDYLGREEFSDRRMKGNEGDWKRMDVDMNG